MLKKREVCNIKLLEILYTYLKQYPDMRFNQALWNLGFIKREDDQIVDNYYEESEITLENVKNIVENLGIDIQDE